MAFDFDRFMERMNSNLDRRIKQKEERESLKFKEDNEYRKRVFENQERTDSLNRSLALENFNLQKQQANDLRDTEYSRKKDIYNVQAGNMNPDTYAALYGGMASGGDNGSGGLRGKNRNSDNNQVDYATLLSDAYKNRSEDDLRSFGDFAQNEMETIQKLFPQQQQMSAGDAWKAQRLKRNMDFNNNLSMSRDADGKMRFTDKPNVNADAKGWGNVKSNVQTTRIKDPIFERQYNFQPLGNYPSNPAASGVYDPNLRKRISSQSATQPAVTPAMPIKNSVRQNIIKEKSPTSTINKQEGLDFSFQTPFYTQKSTNPNSKYPYDLKIRNPITIKNKRNPIQWGSSYQ